MMLLYDPWLALLAFATTAIYAGTRSFAYRLYRRANEEAVVYAASENSHFLESLRGMASIKALVIGDRRQGIWNNYLVDRVGAELRVAKIDMIFKVVLSIQRPSQCRGAGAIRTTSQHLRGNSSSD